MKKNLKELKDKLDLGVAGSILNCYGDEGRIEDLIVDIADNLYDTQDLFQWAKEHVDKVEEKICLFFEIRGEQEEKDDFNLKFILEDAKFDSNLDDIYDHIKNILIDYIYYYLISKKGIDEIEEDLLNSIIESVDFNNLAQDLRDIVNTIEEKLKVSKTECKNNL